MSVMMFAPICRGDRPKVTRSIGTDVSEPAVDRNVRGVGAALVRTAIEVTAPPTRMRAA
jgi:hypothetical protein